MDSIGVNGDTTGKPEVRTRDTLSSVLRGQLPVRHQPLCSTCHGLGVAPEKFIIDGSPAPVPSHNRIHQHPVRTSNLAETKLNSGVGPRPLGTLSLLEGEERRNCPLCSLVSRAIRRYGDKDLTADPACFWEWSIDGRQTRRNPGFYGQPSNVTRRLRIFWSSSPDGAQHADRPETREHEVYLLFVPPRSRQRLISNALDILDPGSDFLGRDFSDGGIQALMRKWIDICEENHEGACRRIEGAEAFLELTQQTSFGVIDVVNLKLTKLPYDRDRPHRYVALSYVWGPKLEEDYRTLRRNVFDRIRHGGLDKKVLDTLPLTIQHAIQLVRDLGERYLWVDALCIVQDSDTCWEQNAKSMDLIYGNAHFTICAADGDDSSVGLIATGQGKERPEVPLKEKVLPGVELLVSRPLEEVVDSSTWNSRAWTFQERILSRRCLVFVGGRVYFQCRRVNLSQDVYPDGSGTGWSLDWRDSPLRTLRDAKERPIWFYMKCVSLYTGRRLSLPKDIVPAFDGVSQLMARYMVAPFFYCLPASHFDFALLWQPSRAHKRRSPLNKFPSWSWAGWQDIEDAQKGAHVTYDHKFLDGCLLHMHEWLINRTWIDWHIRDGEGNLMNIWNDYSEVLRNRHARSDRPSRFDPRDDAAQYRWLGYKTTTRPDPDTCAQIIIRPGESRSRSRDYANTSPSESEVYLSIRRHREKEMALDDEAAEAHQLTDDYGRPIRYRQANRPLQVPIPDNPFGNRASRQKTTDPSFTLPILQFFTWNAKFYVLLNPEGQSPGKGLVRCHVADQTRDWCGTVILSEDWATKHNGSLCQFIALSDAKSFTDEECRHWAHYIAKDRDEIEWDLFHVMLIEYNTERLLWERVGIGKVLQQAFDLNGDGWTEVQLG